MDKFEKIKKIIHVTVYILKVIRRIWRRMKENKEKPKSME